MILCGNNNLNMEKNIVLFRAVHRYTVCMILNVFNQFTLCLKFFLKHILYVNNYAYDQICYIPKLKGF